MSLSKILSFIPVSPLVTFFGLGKVTTIKIFWIALASLLIQAFVLLLNSSFQQDPVYWGVPLLGATIILFIVGVVLCTIFDHQKGSQPDDIVIDKVVGMMFTISLTLPALLSTFQSVKSIMVGVCTSFLVCDVWVQNLVGFVFAIPLPYALYFTFHHWHLWPEDWIDTQFRNGFGIMLGDVVIGLYSALVTYLILLIPFKIPVLVIIQFFEYTIPATELFLEEFIVKLF